jgi:hypothetical protein
VDHRQAQAGAASIGLVVKNGSKACSSTSRVMPPPVSITAIRT